LHKGTIEYLPIVFNKNNFSIAELLIASLPVELKTSKIPLCEAIIDETVLINNALKGTYNKFNEDSISCQVISQPLTLTEMLINLLGPLCDSKKIREEYLNVFNDSAIKFTNILNEIKKKFTHEALIEKSESILTLTTETGGQIAEELKEKSDLDQINTDLLQISNNAENLWYQLIQCLNITPYDICSHFKLIYDKQNTEFYHKFIHTILTKSTENKIIPFNTPNPEDRLFLSTNIRKSLLKQYAQNPIQFSELLNLKSQIDEMPIIIEDTFESSKIEEIKKGDSPEISPENGKGNLVVLVHGFMGSFYDTNLMKNVISTFCPNTQFLCSCRNENLTEGEIQNMGIRLANEIKDYIKEWFPNNSLQKLSFIGHSMGGIIIRSALPLLEEYSKLMDLYWTFSSPHLGCFYQSSKLVGAGMWIMKKWKNSNALDQLVMNDNEDLKNTFMYKLSETIVFWYIRIIKRD